MLRGHLVERAEALLGTAVVATTPIAGGEASTATRLRLSNGTSALVKTHPRAPAGFFAAEARGLRMLREAGAPAVEVLAQADDAIVVRWHEPVRPTAELAAGFGRALAALHTSRGADAERFGGEQDGFIAALPLPNRGAETWPEFYATRRVLPYLKLARDRGHVTPAQGAMVEQDAAAFALALLDIFAAFGNALQQIGKEDQIERLGKAQRIDSIDRGMATHRHHRRGQRTNLRRSLVPEDIFDKVCARALFDGCQVRHHAPFRSNIVPQRNLC